MIVTGNCNTPDAENLLIIDNDVLRDLFAAFALAGILNDGNPYQLGVKWCAAAAYDLADAMLAQRAKGEKS